MSPICNVDQVWNVLFYVENVALFPFSRAWYSKVNCTIVLGVVKIAALGMPLGLMYLIKVHNRKSFTLKSKKKKNVIFKNNYLLLIFCSKSNKNCISEKRLIWSFAPNNTVTKGMKIWYLKYFVEFSRLKFVSLKFHAWIKDFV